MIGHLHLARTNRGSVTLRMALAVLAASVAALEAQNTAVTGVVKNASGKPVAGAMVKVRSADLGLGFLVVSQAQGRYSTPNLRPGKYTVQAFGGGYQSEPAGPVEVNSGAQANRDVVLSAPQKMPAPRPKGMTNADFEKLMPAGDGKRLILGRCLLCHGLDRTVRTRGTREQWEKMIEEMQDSLRERRIPLSDPERETIVDYVAQNFGPDVPALRQEKGPERNPNENLPRRFLQGEEAKFVAMEFALPRDGWVHHMAVDSRGVAWFSEWNAGVLGRFDPKSLTYSRITPPPGKFPQRFINSVRTDSQDHVWFTDNAPNGILFRYNPQSKKFDRYDIPVPPGLRPNLNTIRFLDGMVWGTGISSNQLLKLDPSTGKWTQYPVLKGSHPYGMAVGGDRMIWYSAQFDNAVVRLDPATGQRTQFRAPSPQSDLRQMQADSEGNLWVGGNDSGKLLKVDYRTGKITEYPIPTPDAGAFTLDVDTTRNRIWFGEMKVGKLGRYDPRSNTFVEFPLPSAETDSSPEFSDSKVIWLAVDRSRPNRVWWGTGVTPRIGYIEALD